MDTTAHNNVTKLFGLLLAVVTGAFRVLGQAVAAFWAARTAFVEAGQDDPELLKKLEEIDQKYDEIEKENALNLRNSYDNWELVDNIHHDEYCSFHEEK